MTGIVIIILLYVIGTLLFAWWISRKSTLDSFFLNKRNTSLWVMTFSTIATVVGAGSTVAIVAEVYRTGISYGIALPIAFITGMFLLAFVSKRIKEVGDQYKAHTLIDFFAKRFDRKNKNLVGILQLFVLVVWIGMQAVAFAALFSVLTGVGYQMALVMAAIVTILYAAIGGLRVALITDFFQFWIILAIILIMGAVGYEKVGGLSSLQNVLPAGHFDLFAFGGVGWFIAIVLFSGFLFLGNTAEWQRIFAVRNAKMARRSFLLTIPFFVIIGVTIIMLGLYAVNLVPGVSPEQAFFKLMDNILPWWLVGIGFASVLAIIMSSVDILIVGGSTVIYKALFDKKKTTMSAGRQLFYARAITVLFGGAGFLIAFFIPNIITLQLITVYMSVIFAPAIFAGLYMKRISSNASFYGILIPTILLFTLWPSMNEGVVIVTTPTAIAITFLYDKVFGRRKHRKVSRVKTSAY